MNVNIPVSESTLNLNIYQIKGFVDKIEKFEISNLLRLDSILKCKITFEDKHTITTVMSISNVSMLLQGVVPEKIINNSSLNSLGLQVITEENRKITDMFLSQLEVVFSGKV